MLNEQLTGVIHNGVFTASNENVKTFIQLNICGPSYLFNSTLILFCPMQYNAMLFWSSVMRDAFAQLYNLRF